MAQWDAKDKTFLITGGASGLGAGYAERFLRHGAKQGLVSFTLKGVQHMRKDEGGAGGTIINNSSVAALVRVPFVPIYEGSKIAVLHFSQCLAMDPFYEDTGIRVLIICFGILHNIETRSYHPKLGKMLAAAIEPKKEVYQKVESAVTALVEMFKIGSPRSIWLSIDNKPVREITLSIDRVFKDFENLLM